MSNRIDTLTTFHNEASNKLDYFILGANLAICGYLAQTNPYGKIGVNEATFLLGTLLVFAVCAIVGFKRIESNITMIRMNAAALEFPDPAIRTQLIGQLRSDKTSTYYYKARNYLMFAGLICYLTTKVWAAY